MTNYPDLINASFEGIGAILTWRNSWQLYRDREIRGVYWPATAFWAAWGIWNVYYYRHLEQILSWWAGVFLVTGNIAWVVMALMWRKK